MAEQSNGASSVFNIENFHLPVLVVVSIIGFVAWAVWSASNERSALDVKLQGMELKLERVIINDARLDSYVIPNNERAASVENKVAQLQVTIQKLDEQATMSAKRLDKLSIDLISMQQELTSTSTSTREKLTALDPMLKNNFDHISTLRSEVAGFTADLREVETQFCAADIMRNLTREDDLRHLSVLWNKIFTQELPINNAYYPTICNRGTSASGVSLGTTTAD